MTDNAPTPHLEDQPVDTYTDLTARLAAADLGWSHEHGDPPANPDYIKRLAFQVMAFKPPLIAGVYVDDEMLDDMRDRLHGDNCGCGEWDSHSQEYVERMDETIHAVLYPLRHPVRPVSQGTEDSPEVVCICGSMRFRDLMLAVAADETAAGRIVLMPFAVVAPVDQGSGFKRMLDTLHRRKIDLAGRVIVVMDESGYYGESTRGEIEYASKTGKVVSFQAVERTAEDSDYREQIARALLASSDSRTDLSGTHDIQIITADAAAELHDRVVSPLVEQLRQARAAYNRMAGHAVDRAAERDRYYLAWQSAARGRRQARVERDTARNQFLDHYNGTAGQLDRIRELQDALRERTGQRDEARQELAGEKHVRRLNEHGLLGQLAALRSTAVVLPEDWRQMLADGDYPEQVVDLIESWRAAPVVEFEAADSPSPVSKSSQTAAPAEAETPARPIGMVYLLNQYDRLLSAVEHIRMDTPEDRDRHARVIATFRRAAEPVREQVEGAALPEVEITDEHVREHDDAAPTRDEVVEEWADAWDGDDRTPEWVRVVEPCPVPECTIPQVHGHEGYGLRFTPAAQPEPQGEPDEDWCGRFADDGKHYCPEGHNTVYQMFSGGREWYCADCGTQGTYPPAPADVGPRARLLTQSGGAAELKRHPEADHAG